MTPEDRPRAGREPVSGETLCMPVPSLPDVHPLRSSGQRAGLVLVVLGILLAACSKTANLDPSQPSSVEGLPLPRTARLQFSHALQPSPVQGPGVEAVYVVENAALSQIVQWYKEKLPDGEPWGTWSVCNSTGGIYALVDIAHFPFARGWHRPDGASLGLALESNSSKAVTITLVTWGGPPPGVHDVSCQ
jgi:hypothetical protein